MFRQEERKRHFSGVPKMADYGIQLGKLVFVGLLGVILTIDCIAGLQALYYWQQSRAETSADLFQPSSKLERLLTAQQAQLTDYRIVDAKKGIVSIPIGRAMDFVLAELHQQATSTAIPERGSP
jgi:hypothetical protein